MMIQTTSYSNFIYICIYIRIHKVNICEYVHSEYTSPFLSKQFFSYISEKYYCNIHLQSNCRPLLYYVKRTEFE